MVIFYFPFDVLQLCCENKILVMLDSIPLNLPQTFIWTNITYKLRGQNSKIEVTVVCFDLLNLISQDQLQGIFNELIRS